MKKEKRITIYKKIWCKIRYWQSLKDVSDTELAAYLQVCERTLRDYDKNARNITLEKVDNFLVVNSMELDELLAM
jgi:predicted transcriptional regulator